MNNAIDIAKRRNFIYNDKGQKWRGNARAFASSKWYVQSLNIPLSILEEKLPMAYAREHNEGNRGFLRRLG